ncbi:MAG: cysteine peptidase family C39 domain-containing protein [Elusimicrobiota bacterium]
MTNDSHQPIDILDYIEIPPIRRIIASITLVSFLMTSVGFNVVAAAAAEQAEDQKDKQQPSVYYKWATVQEQAQQGVLTEYVDSEKNQVYRFDKSGKLAEVEDRNTSTVYKYEYDSENNAKVTTVKKDGQQEKSDTDVADDKAETKKEQKEQEIKVSFDNYVEKKQQEQQNNLQKDDQFQPKEILSVKNFLTEYFSSDPQKQQELLLQVGVTEQQLKNFSEESYKKVIQYLSSNKKTLGEVTTENLSKLGFGVGKLVNEFRAQTVLFFTNIIKAVLGQKDKDGFEDGQVSIQEIQDIAKQFGIELLASIADTRGLKTLLEIAPAIVHLNLEDGKGLFVIVTQIKNGSVIYIDADGKERKLMSEQEFETKFSGKILSLSSAGSEIDTETKKNTKGTFFAKLFSEIRKIFSGPNVTAQSIEPNVTAQSIEQIKTPDESNNYTQRRPINRATTTLQSIQSFLDEYISASPAKKAEMAATLGLSVDQLVNLSAETAQQILNYLESQGAQIFNCAIQALKNIFTGQGVQYNINDVAAKAILIDIITGSLVVADASVVVADLSAPLQLSMFSIQKTAALYGVQLTGYSTDINGLAAAVGDVAVGVSQHGVVVHLDLGNGIGHFVVVTSVRDGIVIYIDSDGSTKTVSQEEFQKQWTGNILSTNKIAAGKVLSVATLQTLRGAFIGGAISQIIQAMIQAIIEAIMQALIKAITNAIMQKIVTGKIDWKALGKQFFRDVGMSLAMMGIAEGLSKIKIGALGNNLGKVLGGLSENPWFKQAAAVANLGYFFFERHKRIQGKEVPKSIEKYFKMFALVSAVSVYMATYIKAAPVKIATKDVPQFEFDKNWDQSIIPVKPVDVQPYKNLFWDNIKTKMKLAFQLHDIQMAFKGVQGKDVTAEDKFLTAIGNIFTAVTGILDRKGANKDDTALAQSNFIAENIFSIIRNIADVALAKKQYKYDQKMQEFKDKYGLTDDEYDEIMKAKDDGKRVDWKKYGIEDGEKFNDELNDLSKERYADTRGWARVQSIGNLGLSVTGIISQTNSKIIEATTETAAKKMATFLPASKITYSANMFIGELLTLYALSTSDYEKANERLKNADVAKKTAEMSKAFSDLRESSINIREAKKEYGWKWDYPTMTFDKQTGNVVGAEFIKNGITYRMQFEKEEKKPDEQHKLLGPVETNKGQKVSVVPAEQQKGEYYNKTWKSVWESNDNGEQHREGIDYNTARQKIEDFQKTDFGFKQFVGQSAVDLKNYLIQLKTTGLGDYFKNNPEVTGIQVGNYSISGDKDGNLSITLLTFSGKSFCTVATSGETVEVRYFAEIQKKWR